MQLQRPLAPPCQVEAVPVTPPSLASRAVGMDGMCPVANLVTLEVSTTHFILSSLGPGQLPQEQKGSQHLLLPTERPTDSKLLPTVSPFLVLGMCRP